MQKKVRKIVGLRPNLAWSCLIGFFLGRRGRPLKYETAKQDIPDLTPERYSNVMRTQYQDRGLLGLRSC